MDRLPSNKRLYRALVQRDSSFDGIFVVGVTSTRIFCRPVCPARKPRPENCEFFAEPREALHAGFRPCLRCRPLDRNAPRPPVVQKLLDLVERHPDRRFREADLHGLGLDPTTARRLFVRHCGMTFHAYQRARRMGAALIDLRQHRDVPRAMDVGGYESFSGFGGAFAGIFGKPPSRASSVNVLLAERIATPLGPMVAIARDDELCLLEFHDRRALELEVAWLRHRHDAVVLPGTNDVLRQIACELEQYFRGERTAFATPVALAGSPFQVSVWRELSRIAPGETRSYAQIADAVGRPGALRAVGRANGENRVALVIPCHRVIRADGTTSGYGGGAWRKEWLLAHEQRRSRPFPAITPRAAQDAR